jgi:hypothetical protein
MKPSKVAIVIILAAGLVAQGAQAQHQGIPMPVAPNANSTQPVLVLTERPTAQIRPNTQVDNLGFGLSRNTGAAAGGAAGAAAGALVTGPGAAYGGTVGLIAGGAVGANIGGQSWPLTRDAINRSLRTANQPNPDRFYKCPNRPGKMFKGGCPR